MCLQTQEPCSSSCNPGRKLHQALGSFRWFLSSVDGWMTSRTTAIARTTAKLEMTRIIRSLSKNSKKLVFKVVGSHFWDISVAVSSLLSHASVSNGGAVSHVPPMAHISKTLSLIYCLPPNIPEGAAASDLRFTNPVNNSELLSTVPDVCAAGDNSS